MRLAVIGGDRRFAYLAALANARGIDARAFCLEGADVPGIRPADIDQLTWADVALMPNPFDHGLKTPLALEHPSFASVVKRLSRDTVLALFGAGEPDAEALSRFSVLRLNDEHLTRRLARQTAEGAIWTACSKLERELWNCPVLLVGYGRIARALGDLLNGYGARVTVAARAERARADARKSGARAIDMTEMLRALPAQTLVFSTPPQRVLSAEQLTCLPPGAWVFDLSSPPYGVDVDTASKRGVQAVRLPGVPGHYCPKSAGEALLDALETALKGEM